MNAVINRGLYIWSDSRKYEGTWVNGERAGPGTPYFLKLTPMITFCYMMYISNTNNIVGVLTLLNGDKFDGMFQSNKMHGPGNLDMH